jgi:hypothetical protein
MDDRLYIWFIDSHSKGNCCNENVNFFGHEILLNIKSPFLGQIRGVVLGLEVILFKEESDVFGC